MIKNLAYLLALHSVDGLGPARLKSLLEHFGDDPKLVWEGKIGEIREIGVPENVAKLLEETRKKLDPEQYFKEIQDRGIKMLTLFDEEFPKLLKQIYDPPIILYYKGEFLPADDREIGVVGTRKITGYGKLVTEKFTTELVNFGFTIVSGLARGVDSVAHLAAINAGGRTIAVLGSGLNNIYPPENIGLANKITSGQGVVLSELPPDKTSMPGNFPARNRIISGLSKAVLVTEAASDSGSLITARLAIDQGRDVFAIPGPVTSDLSKGPADLIKEGARLVFEPKDILEEMGMNPDMSSESRVQSTLQLSAQEKLVLEALKNENKHIDEIGRSLELSAASISATLLKMEIQGLVRNLGGGVYCLT